ncbi:hypothetical protein HNY73_019593 [Argiope bruennichi]|uniref:Uncharacterized protein n=1 Tax=Argiope bruennichi TaxID=94029 RepID=A0A8T0E5D2_ARGBR|nr:hypothetical protein HNY73_019593 [Argiope bruennichi]
MEHDEETFFPVRNKYEPRKGPVKRLNESEEFRLTVNVGNDFNSSSEAEITDILCLSGNICCQLESRASFVKIASFLLRLLRETHLFDGNQLIRWKVRDFEEISD